MHSEIRIRNTFPHASPRLKSKTIAGKDVRIDINIVKNMHANVLRVPINSRDLVSKLSHYFLADPRPENPEVNSIDVLIGNDFYEWIIQPERVELVPQQIWLKKSLLGWIITGRGIGNTSDLSHFTAESGTLAMYAKTSNSRHMSHSVTDHPEVTG